MIKKKQIIDFNLISFTFFFFITFVFLFHSWVADGLTAKQLENEIKGLDGQQVTFKKMHSKRLKFHKRRYKLDVQNQRLVASTRKYQQLACCMRERVYEFEDLCEVNNGVGSVNLQAYKNKHKNRKEEVCHKTVGLT